MARVSPGFGYQSELELRVAETARRQYNKLKMQTKTEIRQTLDQLLVGEFIVSQQLHWSFLPGNFPYSFWSTKTSKIMLTQIIVYNFCTCLPALSIPYLRIIE